MSMSASEDPDVFLTQVQDQIEEVSREIESFVGVASALLTQAIAVLQNATPIGAVVALVVQGMEQEFNAGVDRIDQEWTAGQQSIWESINLMLGNPLQMSAISSAYRDAVATLGDQTNTISNGNALLGVSWSGRAFEAYTEVSTNQQAAIDGMNAMLLNAADILDDGAESLVRYWTQQLQNLVDLVTDIISEAAKLGDVGNWATAGAGVLTSLIATCVQNISTIFTTYLDYWAELNIGQAGDWDGLNSQFGVNGLPERRWPIVPAGLRGAINEPWEPTG